MQTTMTPAAKQAVLIARRERFEAHVAAFEAQGLPEAVLQRARTPMRAEAVAVALDIVVGNPFEAVLAMTAVPKSLRKLARVLGVSAPVEAIDLPQGFAMPSRMPTVTEVEAVLSLVPKAEKLAEGVYRVFHTTVDFNAASFEGKAFKSGFIITPDGREVLEATASEMLCWALLGAIQGVTQGNPRKQFLGHMRAMYAQAAESKGCGHADEANTEFSVAKPAAFQLVWAVGGYALRRFEDLAGDAATAYRALADKVKGIGAHHQGNYLVDLRKGGLAMELDGDDVVLSSTAEAKWFKRHTLNLALQEELRKPDTSFFSTGSGDHEGRLVKSLFLMDGLNFPYLGNLCALVDRKTLARTFRPVTKTEHAITWNGTHSPALPAVGSRVRKGAVLVDGVVALVAKTSGYVVEARFTNEDEQTQVRVVLGRSDMTGQFKLRGTVKGSVAYPAWTNIDWTAFCAANGFTAPQVVAGDVAVLSGLNAGDEPVLAVNQDANKGVGSGFSGARVSVAANTLGERVAYSPKADADGAYDDLMHRFEAKALRKVTAAYAVLPAIAEDIAASGRKDVAFYPWGQLVVVIQTTSAYYGVDCFKVESLGVSASYTRSSRMPLQVAMALASQGRAEAVKEILAASESPYATLLALHECAATTFDIESNVLAVAGAPVVPGPELAIIDVANLSDRQRAVLGERAAKPLELAKRLAFVDTVVGDCAVLDPLVLQCFGTSDQDSSLRNLFAELCHQLSQGNVDEAPRLMAQLRGVTSKLAMAPKVNQRAFRGPKVIGAKTSAGNVPEGWVAIGYGSTVAKDLVKAMGLKAGDAVVDANRFMADAVAVLRGEIVNEGVAHADELWGAVVYDYRNPQVHPVALRVYMPDAPAHVLEANQEFLPEGEMFLKAVPALEPDRFYLAPRDTAKDSGDHDGDARYIYLIQEDGARAEALAYDEARDHTRMLETYLKSPVNPVVEAYASEAKKAKWAAPGRMAWTDFVELTARGITNQTQQIGTAYEVAHTVLCVADLLPSEGNAASARSLFTGQYEGMLGGYALTTYRLYETLGGKEFQSDEGFDFEGWRRQLAELNEDGNGFTAGDTGRLIKAHTFIGFAKRAARGKNLSVRDRIVDGKNVNLAVFAALVRALGKGVFDDDGVIDPIFELPSTLTWDDKAFPDWLAEKATTSTGAYALRRFYETLYPLIKAAQDARNAANDQE